MILLSDFFLKSFVIGLYESYLLYIGRVSCTLYWKGPSVLGISTAWGPLPHNITPPVNLLLLLNLVISSYDFKHHIKWAEHFQSKCFESFLFAIVLAIMLSYVALIILKKCFFYLVLLEVLWWKNVGLCHRPFLTLLRWVYAGLHFLVWICWLTIEILITV